MKGQARFVCAALTAAIVASLAACGDAASTGNGVVSGGAACAAQTAAGYLAAARVAFIGVMLPGPTVETGTGKILASPARMHVTRYLKGTGPAEVTVATAVKRSGNTVIYSADGIQPRAGRRWKIFASSVNMPYVTSDCAGSKPL